MRSKIPGALLAITALLLAMLAACGPETDHGHQPGLDEIGPVSLPDGQKLHVVATTNIVADVVQQVGGDRIALTPLMGIGVDPHSYVPSPSDIAAIHDAHVVFANGAGLEQNLAEMLDSAGGQAVEISLSHDLELRPLEDEDADHDHEHEHEDGTDDPHVWFDVQNVIRWVATIRDTLGTLDPAHASVYQANAEAYVQQLEELDAWISAQVDTIPEANRKLVTNHPVFGYLADRYGLEQVGAVYPINPSAEPSAENIAALQDTIRRYDVPAVFAESTVNPRLAEQVARDTGIELVPLYTGSLGGPDSSAESYIEMIRYDVEAIVRALQ